jgi:enamine deaminase RidA (YjgF/YER057c/UK114 family)
MIRAATGEEINEVWGERWGLPIVTPAGCYRPVDVEGLVLLDDVGDLAGLITWSITGAGAEMVSLDAWPPGRGRGSRLLARAEGELQQRGVERISLVTTNDNTRAAAFYIRQGYRLVRLHLDAMDRVRAQKPQVPLTGAAGVPLRDMWELEKRLGPSTAGEPRQLVSSGSPFEGLIGFSRAVRVGGLVVVSGTAPIGDDGKTVGRGDLYLQTRRCIEIAARALERAGASLADVVRTRVLLTGMERWQEAARAHSEAFGSVRPASTFVQVAGFIDPDWLVELEVDARTGR